LALLDEPPINQDPFNPKWNKAIQAAASPAHQPWHNPGPPVDQAIPGCPVKREALVHDGRYNSRAATCLTSPLASGLGIS
jgi:hypothetical protein